MNTLCVIPSYRCNIRCTYCFNDTHQNLVKGDHPHGDPGAAVRIDSICSALARHGLRSLTLSGGEPLLSRLTRTWLASAETKGIGVRIITNLTILPDYVENCLDSGAGLELTVSLGGLEAASHERFRQRFFPTISNLERLRRHRTRVTISFMLDRLNASQLGELEDYCHERGFNLVLSPLSPQGGGVAVEGACLSGMSEGGWRSLEPRAGSLKLRLAVASIRAFHEGRLNVASCAMRNSILVLTPDGGLYGCFFRRDIYHGNLFCDDPDSVLAKLPANGRKPAPCFGQQCLPILINN